jgi:hypothetical protein
MPFKAGDVVRIWDGSIRPPDYKRFVVIWPDEGWVLRINSNPRWKPNWPLSAADNPGCLDHDSYLELHGIVEYTADELNNAELLGYLADGTIEDLIELLPTILTFTEEECEAMVAQLEALFP